MPHPPAAACAAIYVYVATPAQQSPLYLLFPVLVGCAYLVWVQSGIAMLRDVPPPHVLAAPADPPLNGKAVMPAEKPVAPETIEPKDEEPVVPETKPKDNMLDYKPVAPETKPKDKKPLKARVASLRPMATVPKLSKQYIEFKSKFKSTATRVGSFRAQRAAPPWSDLARDTERPRLVSHSQRHEHSRLFSLARVIVRTRAILCVSACGHRGDVGTLCCALLSACALNK